MSRVSRRNTVTRMVIAAAALTIAATPALAREAEPGDDRAPATTSQVVSPPAATPATPAAPAAAKRHGADDGPSHVRHGRHRHGARHGARHGRGADDAPGHVRHGGGADDGPNHR